MNGYNKDYKLSIFNILVDLDEDSIGIYNTLHDSAVVVEKELVKKISDQEGQVDKDILESLLDNRIIFPYEFDEKRYFRYYLNKLKYSPKHATFIIVLTFDCNLCCNYCFEGKNKTSKSMSSEIALKTVQFIFNSFRKNSSLNDLHVAFFGGEPLLNREVMQIICDEISHFPEINNAVKYTLTSNLTTLTDNDIELMKRYQFLNVQVALDGSKELHDSRRKFKTGGGSFDLIMNNIQKLINNDIKVTIILNFDAENEKSYDELIHFIKSQLPYEKLFFTLNSIKESLCNNTCGVDFTDREQVAKIYLKMYTKLKQNNFNMQILGHRDMLCMLNTDVSCVIDPEGLIYKCTKMLGKSEYSVGNIFSNLPYNLNYEMLLINPWEKCLEQNCVYLPICGAGCRSLALLNTGNIKSVYCQKNDYYDKIYQVALKDHFYQLMREVSVNEEDK